MSKIREHKSRGVRKLSVSIKPGVLPKTLLSAALPLMYAACYATILAALPHDLFLDRHNYLVYASSSQEIIGRYLAQGSVTTFANEPLWLLLNAALSNFLEPSLQVRVLIFFSSFTLCFGVLTASRNKLFTALVLLTLPQIVGMYIVHLRQGLALAIFLCGILANSSKVRAIAFLASALVHSSYFFIVLIYMAAVQLKKSRLDSSVKTCALIVSLVLVVMTFQYVAEFLGARQSSTSLQIDPTGLGFLFWSVIAAIYLTSGAGFLREHLFELGSLATYLLMYFVTPHSARVLESALIFILMASEHMPQPNRLAFSAAITLLAFYGYYSAWGASGLGWGV